MVLWAYLPATRPIMTTYLVIAQGYDGSGATVVIFRNYCSTWDAVSVELYLLA
jgi:hypothetical protein